MRLVCALAAGLALISASAFAQTPSPAPTAAAAGASAPPVDALAGLWKAKRWFGPFGRGPVIIQRKGTAYSADMMGQVQPVHLDKGGLSFELANGLGRFEGQLEATGAIRGHWFPSSSAAVFTGATFASPVRLRPDGPNRWAGEVAPLDEMFSLYLLLRKRADGSLDALLRNPERDYGGQIGVERLTLEGGVVKLLGRRRGQKEERELAAGTYDAENDVITLAFPSRGGSYDFKRDGDESDFYPRGKNPGHYVYRPPPARGDGWLTGSLDEVGIDRAAMERFIQMIVETPMGSVDSPQVHGILVARHGRLVLEEYFHGEHRDKLHDTRSAAKSLTAVMVGAVLQAGAPLKLSSSVYQVMNGGTVPADLDPLKRAMTLEHLLTMSSGYFCDDQNPDAPGNEETMLDQTEEPDYYRYTLKVPMATPPGEKAVYCSSNPHLALGMVSRATGESPLDTFDRLLGAPLKIDRYGWILDPVGHPYGGGSVNLRPRDFMKLGQLMLNGGTWQGRRILSRGFVARASAPLYHLRNISYGYLWWGIEFPYKDRTVRAFFAGGAGGQGVVVIPDLDLVVATFAGNYSSKGTIPITHELIPRFVLPAVREAGDDPGAPVKEREFKSPYGPSPDGSRVTTP